MKTRIDRLDLAIREALEGLPKNCQTGYYHEFENIYEPEIIQNPYVTHNYKKTVLNPTHYRCKYCRLVVEKPLEHRTIPYTPNLDLEESV